MKIGDTVKMSDKNLNHTKTDVCAYGGMKGIVTDVFDDGGFALNCKTSTLVVPMNNAYKRPLKGVWIWLNGELIFHRRVNKPTINHKPTFFEKLKLWFNL